MKKKKKKKSVLMMMKMRIMLNNNDNEDDNEGDDDECGCDYNNMCDDSRSATCRSETMSWLQLLTTASRP